MHDGMQYDPIQGQGHEPLKVGFLKLIEAGFLGQLPNFGSRPNTMGGKFPLVCVHTSVRPQKVSSISMKFGIQVVVDER